MLYDYGKAILLGVFIVCVTVLAALGVLSEGTVGSVLTLILGYLIGNGRAAVKGNTPSPVIGPRLEEGEVPSP